MARIKVRDLGSAKGSKKKVLKPFAPPKRSDKFAKVKGGLLTSATKNLVEMKPATMVEFSPVAMLAKPGTITSSGG